MTLLRDLPINYEPYIDKYFLRSKTILEQKKLNPWVSAQVFIRKGPGKIAGIDEAVEVLEKFGGVTQSCGTIHVLPEGSEYSPGEVIMRIVAPIQSIIALETMYLGIISARTTIENDWVTLTSPESLDKISGNMEKVTSMVGKGRPVFYFGARHWHWSEDAEIAAAAADGGASGASTDAGAQAILGADGRGMGTIPHALENIYAWAIEHPDAHEFIGYHYDSPVVASTVAFDDCMDFTIPRIALVDYRNMEITDSLLCAKALEVEENHTRLSGVRIDTCGENISEKLELAPEILKSLNVPLEFLEKQYWTGNGVSIIGALMVKKALNEAGFGKVSITLSSGFGNAEKVRAFLDAEEILGIKLFDSLGVGQVYPSRATTMDITHIGSSPDTLQGYSKTGRKYRYNSRLVKV